MLMLVGGAAARGEDGATPVPGVTPPSVKKPTCGDRCRLKREHRKLRRATPREPIPTYITSCESGGYLRAHNDSGAGGRYQIMPGTWRANLPRRLIIRIAEYLTPEQARRRERRHGRLDRGPRWSSRLLQDLVAEAIYATQGPAPWSCA